MKINLDNQKTSAQAVTKICYNESTRNLDYKITCEGLKDLTKCVGIIESYNNFDWKIINEALDNCANFKRYYNENNPNNEKDLLVFDIGRESSPVIYIKLLDFGESKYKENGEVRLMTKEVFEKNMKALGAIALADEYDFESDGGYYCFRMWWD